MAEGGFEMDDMGKIDKQEELEQDELDDRDDQNYQDESKVETMFIDSGLGISPLRRLTRAVVEDKMNDFYDTIEHNTGYEVFIRDPNIFNLDSKNRLYVKFEGKTVILTQDKNNNKFLSLSTIKQRTNTDFIRRVLGLQDYVSGKTKEEAAQVQRKLAELHRTRTEVTELPGAADLVSNIVEDLTRGVDVQTNCGTWQTY